ncbi:alkaline phosphatase D family protein [Calycomorphotria hydatis]|uniref:PhoD-like phosphatase n=1 Tax=Calycomorphotria hydatis TaxID=2528027 RepID=A0A517TAQ6_9PLAN|nr:alkaline phosphatase D family protein [Calycomorphotria hydatis]QDT65453.1 PhoD-like phosphatase [Calycomorphotria hydatis]
MPRTALIAVLLLLSPTCLFGKETEETNDFSSRWYETPDRVWPGAEYWTNPMENWRVANGRLECVAGNQNHSVHLLTRQLTAAAEPFAMSVRFGLIKGKLGAAGFLVGVHDEINDYRGNCFFGRGIKAHLSTSGLLRLGAQTKQLQIDEFYKEVVLTLTGQPGSNGYQLTLVAQDADGKVLGEVSLTKKAEEVIGNVALSHNPSGVWFDLPKDKRPKQPNRAPANAQFWFSDWTVTGEKFSADDSRAFGPILWSMHSVSDSRSDEGHVMKMTAVLPPLGPNDSKDVTLQFKEDGDWNSVATEKIHEDAFTATFRIPEWDSTTDTEYRLVYSLNTNDGRSEPYYWTGTVRKEPLDRPLVLGGLTCQEHHSFPYAPVAENVAELNPDMLFFSGDQIYESSGGFGIIRRPADRAILNFLRKQYMFGWAFGDVMRDRPTLCIPDDHDVFQGNIWGEGGKAMSPDGNTSTDGGYIEPIRMVEVVHRLNCSHHPDFYDPTPIEQNMSVYYGDMVYGRVSFAILGDRQFKSAPAEVSTWEGRKDHVRDKNIDPHSLDQDGLNLLGSRQEEFLQHWVGDWRAADMKVVLSETIFNNAATHHGKVDDYLYADLDSNGWPQTPRNQAIETFRKAFPLHVNGDQHLTTLVHYGVDEQRDSNWSFCTPAISVGYQRWWRPDELGMMPTDRPSHGLPNTGAYRDGFDNPIYVYAVGNPEGSRDPNRYQQAYIKASGFGIIRIDRENRTYTCESYRYLDAEGSDLPDQFPGWPKTIGQMENYGRQAVAWLPTIVVEGRTDPVLQVIDEESGELVYALRVSGTQFQPHVFKEGVYTVRVGEQPGEMIVIKGLEATKEKTEQGLQVKFKE